MGIASPGDTEEFSMGPGEGVQRRPEVSAHASDDLIAPVSAPRPAPDAVGTLRRSAKADCEQVAIKAVRLTQHQRSQAGRAVACHDYVRAFDLLVDKRSARPIGNVVRGKRATALEKSNLLAALLRSCEIPSRLHMYAVPGHHLRGLGNHHEACIHPVVEVFINRRWVATDTYHLDVQAALRARRCLIQEKAKCGYGLYLTDTSVWNGHDDATNVLSGLSAAGDSFKDWGVFDDACDWQETVASVQSLAKFRWRPRSLWG